MFENKNLALFSPLRVQRIFDAKRKRENIVCDYYNTNDHRCSKGSVLLCFRFVDFSLSGRSIYKRSLIIEKKNTSTMNQKSKKRKNKNKKSNYNKGHIIVNVKRTFISSKLYSVWLIKIQMYAHLFFSLSLYSFND